MSVSIISREKINKAINTLSKNEAIQNFVKDSEFYKEYNKYGAESAESFIGRALWYGYIANITAWNVQYGENELIDFSDFSDTVEFEDVQEAIDLVGYLLYNVYTNNGTRFLQDSWSNVLGGIKSEFEIKQEPEIPSWWY